MDITKSPQRNSLKNTAKKTSDIAVLKVCQKEEDDYESMDMAEPASELEISISRWLEEMGLQLFNPKDLKYQYFEQQKINIFKNRKASNQNICLNFASNNSITSSPENNQAQYKSDLASPGSSLNMSSSSLLKKGNRKGNFNNLSIMPIDKNSQPNNYLNLSSKNTVHSFSALIGTEESKQHTLNQMHDNGSIEEEDLNYKYCNNGIDLAERPQQTMLRTESDCPKSQMDGLNMHEIKQKLSKSEQFSQVQRGLVFSFENQNDDI